MPTMEVRFSKLNEWYEINSAWEGRFLERVMPGAFTKTIAENRDRMKILFNHGFDPQIGEKVLGTISDLREDADSPVAIVPLFDTSYNRDLLPGLEAGVYGSSMRMRVIKDEWNDEPGPAKHNPAGLPERSIREVAVGEMGPVTFPANPGSTSGVRSMTDTFYAEMRSRDPERVDEMVRSRDSLIALHRTEQPAETTAPVVAAAEPAAPEPAAGHSEGLTPGERRRRLYPTLTERN